MKRFDASKWLFCFEGEGEGGAGAGAGGSAGDPPKTFTQEELNAAIAKEKTEFQKKVKTLNEEIDALKAKTTLTAKEKTDLENKMSEQKNLLLTKEELAAEDKRKREKEHSEVIKSKDTEIGTWKSRYEQSTIERALKDAAGSEAINPDQIADILRPNTRLVEVTDTDGRPTGQFEAMVDYDDYDAEDGPKKLTLKVTDAVKKMQDSKRHFNLFKAEGTGGLGGNNHIPRRGPSSSLKKVSSSAKDYREARKANQIDNLK